jgi:GxxExxY protein
VHESKPRGKLIHRGREADLFECDLLCPNELVAELKALAGPETFTPEHYAQLISYLKFWRIQTGLLLDFGKERLAYRRLIFNEKPAAPGDAIESIKRTAAASPNGEIVNHACESIARVLQAHGLGYRDTTYAGLIAADFAAENIPFTSEPVMAVQTGGQVLGEAPAKCFMLGTTFAVMVLALRNQITSTDRAILQTYLRHLNRQNGLIVNFGKQRLELMYVTAARQDTPPQL